MTPSRTACLGAAAMLLTGPAAAVGRGDLFIVHVLDQPPEDAAATARPAFARMLSDVLGVD